MTDPGQRQQRIRSDLIWLQVSGLLAGVTIVGFVLVLGSQAFKTAEFRAGVEKIGDLKAGMTLEGVVTNVTHFGAFVDVGVHQDGLVHISELADRFVREPHEVVSAGEVVKVRVLEVDPARKRIGLSMRSGDSEPAAPRRDRPPNRERSARKPVDSRAPASQGPLGSLGDALTRARKGRS